MSTVLRYTLSERPWAGDTNPLLRVLKGDATGRIVIHDDDGVARDPRGGTVSTGNYALDVTSDIDKPFRFAGSSGDMLTMDATNGLALGAHLTFSGAGRRIRGDLNNATLANRLLFQGTVTNTQSNVGVIPNGTSTTAGFTAYNHATPASASTGMLVQADSNGGTIYVGSPTGSYQPLNIWTNNTHQVQLTTAGVLQFMQAGHRIAADFTNATLANRLMFQTSTANSPMLVGALPSGTGTSSGWVAYNSSTPATAAGFVFQNTSTAAEIRQEHASNPLHVYVNGGLDLAIDASHFVSIARSGFRIGVFGATPVVQQGAFVQTYSTTTLTHAAPTSTGLSMAVGSADGTLVDVGALFNSTILNNNFQDLVTEVNLLRADLLNVKQFVNSIVDAQQAFGWFA